MKFFEIICIGSTFAQRSDNSKDEVDYEFLGSMTWYECRAKCSAYGMKQGPLIEL